jgi:hypothetical protein
VRSSWLETAMSGPLLRLWVTLWLSFGPEIHVIRGKTTSHADQREHRITRMNRRGDEKAVQYQKDSMFWRCPAEEPGSIRVKKIGRQKQGDSGGLSRR